MTTGYQGPLFRERIGASGVSLHDEQVNHGEVFTREWIVELVLDLAGYRAEADLWSMRALEPACGAGAFLGPMIRRLSDACRRAGRDIRDAEDAIHAVDLQPGNVRLARERVVGVLDAAGWKAGVGEQLALAWVQEDDFILGADQTDTADFVVGNPPYVRLEDVSADVSAAYRRMCPTMAGRADLFVGFFETGLRALRTDGTLAFICADRWMRNQYGRDLRSLISEQFSLEASVAMHDVDAFEEQVSAYPAVTVVRRRAQRSVLRAVTTSDFGPSDAVALSEWSRGRRTRRRETSTFSVTEMPTWFTGSASWPDGTPDQLALLADLESRFPLLEDQATSTRVGIGVATGADGVFVTKDASVVERERLLPLSMASDTRSGTFEWSGHYLVDPWSRDQGLVDLAAYPKLHAYLENAGGALRQRFVATKNSDLWYRTIDRVDHRLTDKPKLLFPDMKATMTPVLESGGFYPHHNLYFVVSESWPLDLLGGLLSSRVAELFIRSYAVRMRGGTLRFQAQYLRRIRVPAQETISPSTRRRLVAAFEAGDRDAATEAAIDAYGVPASALAVFE